ncbi:cation-translocating P-type ATPase [Limosilactobacillus sp.]|uniref:cation-translocating P-type ATPase n=1 Tax=Limosilactobacillus sp. TaxID=2773925 RepID=UPI003F0D222F
MSAEHQATTDKDEINQVALLKDTNSIYHELNSSATGLTKQDVQSRQAKYGKNILQKSKTVPLWRRFLSNFTSTMAWLLWVAGIIAFAAKLAELGIAIWSVNIINGCFSFWQEYQANKATEALNKMMPSYSRVIRNGKEEKVLSTDLVPGDLVLVEEGDDVPADIRVLTSTSLQVNQSSLTGEVNPVNKNSRPVKVINGNHYELNNIICSGTSVVKGDAKGVVVKTGMATDFGQIATLTQNVKEESSPLQKELGVLTKQLSILAVSISVVFFIIATFFVHYPLVKSFIFALGMIVAFIPEGLLPTVTLSLAGAVQRMAKKNALVKRLSSVETLGSASVICSDKTGTLTQNQMTVTHLWTLNHSYEVTGQGYQAQGNIHIGPSIIDPQQDSTLRELLRNGLLADNARIVPPDDQHKRYTILGDPTEACLEVVAKKGGLDPQAERKATPRIKELPFDSDRKMMTVILKPDDQHQFNVATKGAPNRVVDQCSSCLINGKVVPLSATLKDKIMAANDGYARRGLRVLAVAGRRLPDEMNNNLDSATIATVEKDLTFIGLSVMVDPPRPEVRKAAEVCRRAHIKIIMITGDYSLTAKSIAQNIGIVDPNKPLTVVTGADLKQMSDDELKKKLRGEIVFARMAPEQKYRVVQTLQSMGEVVAVTGDGVNDAPALKKADIGVAMGVTGTDVAKEAADMILTDDNFASIVAAIREGRGVYANIRKFLLYILNSNEPEAVPSVLFLLSGGTIPLALTVMQILFIDLGTDLIPAIGLGKENAEKGVMNQPPRSQKSHLINKSLLLKAFAWYGLLASIISTAAYFVNNYLNGRTWPHLATSGLAYSQATTMTLATIIFCQIAAVLNIRYQRNSMFNKHFWDNSMIFIGIIFEIILLLCICNVPFFRGVFGTAPLFGRDWLMLVCIPIVLIVIDELRKLWLRHHLK